METNFRAERQETQAFSCADTSTCAEGLLAGWWSLQLGVSHSSQAGQMTHGS